MATEPTPTPTTQPEERKVVLQVTLLTGGLSTKITLVASNNVYKLKETLWKTCEGRPHPNGQSIAYLGRVLDNAEVLGDCFNAETVPVHTVYLTVAAYAWSDRAPILVAPQTSIPMPARPTMAGYPSFQIGQYTYAPTWNTSRTERHPLDYIHLLHHNCVRALLGYPAYILQNYHGKNIESLKEDAMKYMSYTGVKWPTAFARDQEVITLTRKMNEGLKYSEVVINGRPVLMLSPSSNEPTPLQTLALEIMSYTAPLLAIEISEAELEDLNPLKRKRQALADAYGAAVGFAIAHDLPLPNPPDSLMDRRDPRRRAARGAIRPVTQAIRMLTLGRLIRPLFILGFRAALVFWFLRPMRQPFIPLLMVAWIAWEIYAIVFDHVHRHVAAQAQQLNRRPEPVNGVDGAADIGAGGGARPGLGNDIAGNGLVPGGQRPGDAQAGQPNAQQNNSFFGRLARLFFNKEAKAIFGTPNASNTNRTHTELSLSHRVWSFVVLLIATIHPRFYEDRRRMLEEREREIRVLYGRIREEGEQQPRVAGEEPPPPPPAPPAGWVGQYVNRAREGIS